MSPGPNWLTLQLKLLPTSCAVINQATHHDTKAFCHKAVADLSWRLNQNCDYVFHSCPVMFLEGIQLHMGNLPECNVVDCAFFQLWILRKKHVKKDPGELTRVVPVHTSIYQSCTKKNIWMFWNFSHLCMKSPSNMFLYFYLQRWKKKVYFNWNQQDISVFIFNVITRTLGLVWSQKLSRNMLTAIPITVYYTI